MASYRVKLTAGGELSGPALREVYVAGETYTYSAADAEYVEGVLMAQARFEVEVIPDPVPAQAEAVAPVAAQADGDACAKSADKVAASADGNAAPPAGQGKGGKK